MSDTPESIPSEAGAPDAAPAAPEVPEVPEVSAASDGLSFRIETALTAMGLAYTAVSDNAFLLNVADQPVLVRTTDTVPNVLRVISEWRTGEEVPTDRLTRLEACNDVNGGLPGVKCGLNGDDVIFAAEEITSVDTDVRAMIIFGIEAIGAGTRAWLDRVHELAGRQAAPTS